MEKPFIHQPVMANEIMTYFKNINGKILVDATAGGGGHLALLAKENQTGKILAFDRDIRAHKPDAALGVANKFHNTVQLFHRPFSKIKTTVRELGIKNIDGLLCDLGVSSNQLDDGGRGFSFSKDGQLDMRMDTTCGVTAYHWLEKSSEKEIADALFYLGDEKKSRKIAHLIKKSWPIENSTIALAKLVLSALKQRRWSKSHPATRTFQAIRMAVNHEVLELSTLLSDLVELLAIDGVAVFLSFHSLEDRMIKNTFKELKKRKEKPLFEMLTKKPITATSDEVGKNRRARSAKLRALKRFL